MASRAGHRDVINALELEVKQFVKMAGDHVSDPVFSGNLMQREFRVSGRRSENPGWAVGNDEFQRLTGVGLQVLLEKRKLFGWQLVRTTVVENRKVSRTVIEAVVERVSGVLSKELCRGFVPDIVISGSEVDRETAVRREDLFGLSPFGFGGAVVQALNGVTDRNEEGWHGLARFRQNLLKDVVLSFAGAISKDYEVESLRDWGRNRKDECGQKYGDVAASQL